VIGKVSVAANSSEFLGHSNMSFVNSITLLDFWIENNLWIFENIFLRWVPHHWIIKESVFILETVSGPWWIFVLFLTVWTLNLNLVFLKMLDFRRSISVCWNRDREAPKIILLAVVLISVPVVEIAENTN